MSSEKIKRLKNTAETEFIEKKSVFIGYAVSIKSEEEALEIIKQRKKKYNDATHNVYAYILENGAISRYSDDAEPQGTAGMPVLNSIRMSGITDVLVIVTRYFGGILLGVGGLVRAYSTSATMTLEKAGFSMFEDYAVYSCACTYSDYQRLLPILNSFDVIIDNTDFSSDVTIKFAIKADVLDGFVKKTGEAFAGRIVLEYIETRLDTK